MNAGHKNLHVVGGGSESYFHGWRMRLGHFTGGLVAAVSTVGVIDDDTNNETRWLRSSDDEKAALLVRSSRDRLRSIQYWFEDLLRDVKRTIGDVWNVK